MAREAAQKMHEFSRDLPTHERYGLSDQIRRSSRVVKPMIAEAWARRRHKAVFVSKLDEALGEATETQSRLNDAADAKYLAGAEFRALDSQYDSITRMLSRMIDRADDFCKFAPATDYRSIQPRVEEDILSMKHRLDLTNFLSGSGLTPHLSPITFHPTCHGTAA